MTFGNAYRDHQLGAVGLSDVKENSEKYHKRVIVCEILTDQMSWPRGVVAAETCRSVQLCGHLSTNFYLASKFLSLQGAVLIFDIKIPLVKQLQVTSVITTL